MYDIHQINVHNIVPLLFMFGEKVKTLYFVKFSYSQFTC